MDKELQTLVTRRFAYRVGDYLPKPLKMIYYLVLWITAIYIVYRFLRWLLETFQVLGEFIFEKRNYWTAVWVLFIMAVGSILIAQYWYGLDPFGRTILWLKSWIKGWLPI